MLGFAASCRWRAFMAVSLSILSFCGAKPALAQENQHSNGPTSLLITYRDEPAKRPAFRGFLAHEEMAQLATWQREGIIAGYQILFNPLVSADMWDAMIVLRFSHFTDTARWLTIERNAPGGLSPAGLALARPLNSYTADADWVGGDDTPAADAGGVFYIIPYEYRAEAEYRQYMDGYVLPQIRGWMREGAVTGYRIYMNRFPVGKPWDSLFVLRYRDIAALAQRDAIIAKVRQALQADARWKAWADNKAGIRTESENVIAEALIRP